MLGNIEQVYVSGDESSLLYRSIIKSLKLSNVGIADTSATAGIIITLINQRSKSRTATVSSSARVSELQIIELVDIIISTGNGEILLPKTTLRREKFFTYNEDNVSTNNEENKMLKREMTKKLAKNIIRRLNATIKMINQNEPES
jgi:outer membrane lipopolysaccharide assembly protein LptE/RlpB